MSESEKFYPHQVPIDEYGKGGFRFANMSHKGSILCLPSGIRAWNVNSFNEINIEKLKPIFDEAENIDIFYLGAGSDIAVIKREIREEFTKRKIVLEVLNTGSAISTYNILLSERRKVGAALIAVSD